MISAVKKIRIGEGVTFMPTKPTKIVIADSTEKSRSALRETLQRANYLTVGEARYGKQTVALTRKLCPDLVIIDMDTVSGGIDAVKVISDEHLAPVLVLTSFSQPVTSFREKRSVLACLGKYADDRALLASVQIALSRWREMEALSFELSELKDALAARKLVDRAKGIIMDKYKLGEEESYRRIRDYAMKKRLPIKKVAEAIIGQYTRRED